MDDTQNAETLFHWLCSEWTKADKIEIRMHKRDNDQNEQTNINTLKTYDNENT